MVGRIAGYVVSGILILFGVLYLWSIPAAGSGQIVSRLIVGVISVAVGVGIIWVVRTRGPATIQQITQQVELDLEAGGELNVEKLKCQSCGGELSKDNVSLVQGAVMINCPYCGSTYQLTEEPKW
jgi:DNA-directed RNA polymerase subunit RPC12/RpoP